MVRHQHMKFILPLLFLSVLLLCLFRAGAPWAAPVSVDRIAGSARLANSAFYLADERGELGIAQISAPVLQNRFIPLADGIPVKSGGVTWLRFSLVNSRAGAEEAPAAPAPGPALRLGPGKPLAKAYIARETSSNGKVTGWLEFRCDDNGLIRLPNPANLPLTVYVRVNESAGLWFDPLLLTPEAADSGSWSALRLILGLVLAAALAFCLFRWRQGREEWRLWAAALIACALLQLFTAQRMAQLPSIDVTAIPMLLGCGLALILLPHLGRHLLQSADDPFLDRTLLALSLPGAICTILPLLPSLGWLGKLLPLLPLLLGLTLFPAAAGLLQKRRGSIIFLASVALPFAGALLALASCGSQSGPGPDFTLLGWAASALVLALGQPRERQPKADDFPLDTFISDSDQFTKSIAFKDEDEDGEKTPAPTLTELTPAQPEAGPRLEDVSPREEKADAGPIRIAPLPGEAPAPHYAERFGEHFSGQLQDLERESSITYTAQIPVETPNPKAPELLERISGSSAESMLVEYRNLERPSTPVSWQQPEFLEKKKAELLAEALEAAGLSGLEKLPPGYHDRLMKSLEALKKHQAEAEFVSDNLSEALHGLGEALHGLHGLAHGESSEGGGIQSVFNLARIVRRAHAQTLPMAEMRGITLSWYVSPTLPAFFMGDEDALSTALTYLMQGAVESADSGAVQFLVKPVVQKTDGTAPNGADAADSGLVRFTLIDSTMSENALRRPARLLARAWELARASYGSFNIDFSPSHGTEINFTLKLKPCPPESGQKAEVLPESHAEAALPAGAEAPGELKMPEASPLAEEYQASFAPLPGMFADVPDSLPEPGPAAPADSAASPNFTAAQEAPAARPGEAEEDEEPLLLSDPLPAFMPEPEAAPEMTEFFQAEPQAQAPADPALTVAWEEVGAAEAPGQAGQEIPGQAAPAGRPEAAPAKPSRPLWSIFTDLPGQALGNRAQGTGQEKRHPARERNVILIADPAASGRRLLLRRLDGLPEPYVLQEAENSAEVLKAIRKDKVGLVILDESMPAQELAALLPELTGGKRQAPISTLCLVSHSSRAESLLRLGCTACLDKTESKEVLQQEAARLVRLVPEPPLPEVEAEEIAPLVVGQPDVSGGPEEGHSIFDQMVSSLDEAPEQPEKSGPENEFASFARIQPLDEYDDEEEDDDAGYEEDEKPEAPGPREGQGSRPDPDKLVEVAGLPGEYLNRDLLPKLPVFTRMLKQSLDGIRKAAAEKDPESIAGLAARIAGQSSIYGLQLLERMAITVEKAAVYGDMEAYTDLSEELLNTGARYRNALEAAHAAYVQGLRAD